jgi:fermentation-respiration switch protein FrsA (DUF1100 family)
MWYLALAVGAILLLGLVAASALLYRQLFVTPKTARPDEMLFTPWEFQADYEEVDLVTADGVGFGVWFFRQPGSAQTLIISSGWRGQRQRTLGIAMALWRKGFNVLSYTYRGTPGSDRAQATMGIREVLELQAVIALVRQRINGARIGLLGHSMGAAVSLLGAAGEPSVEALVLDSPYANLRDLLRESVRRRLPGLQAPVVGLMALWLRFRTGCRISEASPIDVLSSLEPRPLFFIHGGDDRVVAVSHSRRLYEAYRGPREIWVVQGAPHTGAYLADRNLYIERVAGFFARHLGLSVSGQLRLVEDEQEVS